MKGNAAPDCDFIVTLLLIYIDFRLIFVINRIGLSVVGCNIGRDGGRGGGHCDVMGFSGDCGDHCDVRGVLCHPLTGTAP